MSTGRTADASSGLLTACDFETRGQALDVTLPLFDRLRGKVAPGGCLILFQPAGPDHPGILKAAKDAGWQCLHALTWLKDTAAPGNPQAPYVRNSERILVFAPEGQELRRHDNDLPRGDVLVFPTVTLAAARRIGLAGRPAENVHMFQKPQPLLDMLIRRHSAPGELVVEPFGCSGSACLAARRYRRRWIYIESCRENFEWGRDRLQRPEHEPEACL